MKIELTPIAHVLGGRDAVEDDHWGEVTATIVMDCDRFSPDAIAGLESFSHLIVVYSFHQVDPGKIEVGSRHPRNNPAWPKIGIFAQRGKNRPNRIGVSTCRILGIEGCNIHVQGLDAINGTPVLDLKPHMSGFEPQGEIREPEWAQELMKDYW